MKDTDISNYLYEKSLEIEPRNSKQLPKCPRKWPDLNLKSPGLKSKIRVPSVSSKDMDVQGRRNLSSSSSLVIQMDKRDADDSVFAQVTFTLGKNNDVPPVPPRLSKMDGSFRPPIPPRRVAPPLPPRRLQAEEDTTLKKCVVDLSKPEINQDFNWNKKLVPAIIPSKKTISDLKTKAVHSPKLDNTIECLNGSPFFRPEVIQNSRFSLKLFVLKKKTPSMFQFNV